MLKDGLKQDSKMRIRSRQPIHSAEETNRYVRVRSRERMWPLFSSEASAFFFGENSNFLRRKQPFRSDKIRNAFILSITLDLSGHFYPKYVLAKKSHHKTNNTKTGQSLSFRIDITLCPQPLISKRDQARPTGLPATSPHFADRVPLLS